MNRYKKLMCSLAFMVLSFITLIFVSIPVSAKETSNVNDKSNTADESWKIILENVDIDIKYLEPNKYLGLFFDSYAEGNSKDAFLYLCWTSKYISNPKNTILQFAESGTAYRVTKGPHLPDNGRWLVQKVKQYPQYDLNLYMTPIGGIKDGKSFGIKLKRNYNFTSVLYGYEGSNRVVGRIGESMQFDFGYVPENNGKNAIQLCTHGYEIIKECEAQSYFNALKYGGYGHFVHFNTTIPIDKIYRVDVSYKILNDNKPWYEFLLPNDEHLITKSLRPGRISAGIFGLFKFEGFSQGSYKSTKDSSINYKYQLHLNYDDDAWNIFQGKEFYESNYRRISQFKILRMNYVVDNKTYDVPIKMDVIEGDSLSIFDSDLILDTETDYYDFKKGIDDFFREANDQWVKYKKVILIVAGTFGGILVLAILIKFVRLIKFILGPSKESNSTNNKDSDNSNG